MTQSSTTTQLAYGIEQAAEMIGKSRSAMFQAVAGGEIQSYKDGRRRMVSARALAEYVARKEREGRVAA